MNRCKYCGKEINNKGSLASHEKQCIENPNRIPTPRSPNSGAKKGCIGHNKGIKLTDEHKQKISNSVKNNPRITGKGATEEKELERIRKITENAKLKNGGYRKGSGRGKKGWYKGYFCDSSWELAFLLYHLDNNTTIERCVEVRQYVFNNTVKCYYPDFIVNNVIYEIKGYETEQSKAKQKYNPDIILLNKYDMKFYLNYAIDKYTKNFISLYENN